MNDPIKNKTGLDYYRFVPNHKQNELYLLFVNGQSYCGLYYFYNDKQCTQYTGMKMNHASLSIKINMGAFLTPLGKFKETTMTNADKVRNSKNVWRVLDSYNEDLRYRCQDGKQIEWRRTSINNDKWLLTNNDYINQYFIEEIIPGNKYLSSFEEMIANSGVAYETVNKTTGFIQIWKWENNRTLHGIKCNCADQITWEECLVSTVETAIRNSSEFKKYEDLETRLKNVKLPKDMKYADGYLECTAAFYGVRNYSVQSCEKQLEIWQAMKLLCQEIEKEK